MNVRAGLRALRVVGAMVACALVWARPVAAQGVDSVRQPPVAKGAGKPLNDRRPAVDKLQARIDAVLRERLQLTDEQFGKLRALNARLDADKRSLRAEEGDLRHSLREELLPGATPNDSKLTELLDRWPALERKRVALQEREQKELAQFLHPVQRARFFALQDELRRSLQDVQWRRDGSMGEGRGNHNGADSTDRPPFRGGRGRGMRPPPPPPDNR